MIVPPFIDRKYVVNCMSVGVHASVDGDTERTTGCCAVCAALLGSIFLFLGLVWATPIAPEIDGDLLFFSAVSCS